MKREIIYTYLLLIMIALVTMTTTSFAMGSRNPTKRPGPNLVCNAHDDGWEEHGGGHGSCGECLSKHGGCYQKCSEVSYSCTAKGTSPSGESVSIQAIGHDRYQTADEALRRCQSSGATNCRSSTYSDCNEVLNEVSRTRCQRSASLDSKSEKIGLESYLYASHVAKEAPVSASAETP